MKGEDLLDRIISGDQSAFKELVRKYRHTVFLSVLSILHDPDEAEEIAQEVFLKVHLHLSGLRDQNAFERWLRSISCNLAIDRLRERARRESCIPLDEVAPEDLLSPSADEELLKREAVEEVMRAIEELPEGEREILREHLLEDKGYRELSEKYGLSYHAVVMRVRRAKEKVREKVLKRLGCVVILPCREIVKVIGGVVMKVSTKVAITGAVVMMLAGTGIWMSHHREEKRVPESNEMKVEKQTTVGAPARVTVSNSEPQKKEDELTFEEFNRLLDEYFGITSEIESTVPEEKMTSPEEKMSSASDEIAEEQPIGETHKENPQREETNELKQMEIDMVKVEITELMLENGRIWRRLEELSQMERHGLHVDPKEVEQLIIARREMGTKIFPKIARYILLTGDTKATYPGGWIWLTDKSQSSVRENP
ncbi:sigma-70 family RNA polymerase sigma factor [Candidatus Poribacteria bacterium]|nr:sigma-70 family RNA polymerase sigma factor [Candidatus Poribacteria bacterium]